MFQQNQPNPNFIPKKIEMKNNNGKRLFIGCLPKELNETEIRKIVINIINPNSLLECYVNKEKSFALLDFDTRESATIIKNKLDNKAFYARTLIVKHANHKAAIFVKYIPESISNELLYKAFEQFGPVERAVIVCDAQGKSLNCGIVEFERKHVAVKAVKECSEKFYCLGRFSAPIRAELFLHRESEDGFPEHRMFRNGLQMAEISVPAYFSNNPIFLKWNEILKKQEFEKNELKTKQKNEREMYLVQMKGELFKEEQFRMQQTIIPINQQNFGMNAFNGQFPPLTQPIPFQQQNFIPLQSINNAQQTIPNKQCQQPQQLQFRPI